MEHSNQVREFILSSDGVGLTNAYLGPEGVLMGSARVNQEAQDREVAEQRERELRGKKRFLETRKATLAAQMAALKEDLASMDGELEEVEAEARIQEVALAQKRNEMARIRKAD
jgi:circadian clock protein KaiC